MFLNSRTPRRSCCEMRVMRSMTNFFRASLQSAGGFYRSRRLKTPTDEMNSLLPLVEVGVFSDEINNTFFIGT